jgi:hypothetical protein
MSHDQCAASRQMMPSKVSGRVLPRAWCRVDGGDVGDAGEA